MTGFVPAGYAITKNIELDPIPESAKYKALTFSLDDQGIIYRKGKVTADRPGAFLAIWQRPSSSRADSP
ncbi:MepB family protein [Moritella marina]|uniref:MepB family protein n=1 Tax=Moritella marina TaxID=90736 RepID=UPI003703E409